MLGTDPEAKRHRETIWPQLLKAATWGRSVFSNFLFTRHTPIAYNTSPLTQIERVDIMAGVGTGFNPGNMSSLPPRTGRVRFP